MEIKALYEHMIDDLSTVGGFKECINLSLYEEVLNSDDIVKTSNDKFSMVLETLSDDPPEAFGPFKVAPEHLSVELFDKALQVLGVFKKLEPCLGVKMATSSERIANAKKKFFDNVERMRKFNYEDSPFPEGLEEKLFSTLSPLAVVSESLKGGNFPSGNTKETGKDLLDKIHCLETVRQTAIVGILTKMFDAYDEFYGISTFSETKNGGKKRNRRKEISALTQSVWAAIHGVPLHNLKDKEVVQVRKIKKDGSGYRKLLQRFVKDSEGLNANPQEFVDRMSFVTKNPEIDRIIFVQGARKITLSYLLVEGWCRILKDVGIVFPSGRKKFDFTDQNLSRKMGRKRYSFSLDSKSASDSYSWAMMKRKLPFFTNYFSSFACSAFEIDGVVKESSVFTGMGSVFCFPMQTVIFYAICEEVCRELGVKDIPKKLRTYGDDIIFESDVEVNGLYEACIERMEATGFVINKEKSFSSNSLMTEVCGAMFFKGCDVRPIYLRRTDFGISMRNKEYNAEKTPSLVNFYNGMCMKGMYKTSAYVREELYKYESLWHFGSYGYGVTTALEPHEYIAVKDRSDPKIPFVNYGLLQVEENAEVVQVGFHQTKELSEELMSKCEEEVEGCTNLWLKYKDDCGKAKLRISFFHQTWVKLQRVLHKYSVFSGKSVRKVFKMVVWRKIVKLDKNDKTKKSLRNRLFVFVRSSREAGSIGTTKVAGRSRVFKDKRSIEVKGSYGLNIKDEELTLFLSSDKPLQDVVKLDIRTSR